MPTRADAQGRGFAIALAAHAALVAWLAVGVQWRSSQPAVMQAELWAAVPQAAAPRETTPPTPPAPTAPAPPLPPPPPPPRVQAAPPPPAPDPQIAIEQRRREQAERERERREQEEQARRERERQQQAQRERQQRERQQREQAQREQQERDQQRRDQAQRERQQREEQQRQAARAEAQRQANLERLQGLAGATGAADARGSAERSAGPSATYAGRIKAAILPNIVFPDAIVGNPAAEVEVRVGPTGTILGRALVKSSGVREWDEAVLRAIDRTGTLPRDTDGRVVPVMVLAFKPRD